MDGWKIFDKIIWWDCNFKEYMIKFDYKFLKIYAKIKQKGEENETMVRDP